MMTIYEYRSLDKIVLGTFQHLAIVDQDQAKFDEHNCEAIMLIKLCFTVDQLPQVPFGKSTAEIWEHLKVRMKHLIKAVHCF